jgi:hypothetical protein
METKYTNLAIFSSFYFFSLVVIGKLSKSLLFSKKLIFNFSFWQNFALGKKKLFEVATY